MRTLPESQLGFWGTLEAPTPMPAVVVVAVDGAEGHVLGVDALAVARAVVLAGLEAAAAAA